MRFEREKKGGNYATGVRVQMATVAATAMVVNDTEAKKHSSPASYYSSLGSSKFRGQGETEAFDLDGKGFKVRTDRAKTASGSIDLAATSIGEKEGMTTYIDVNVQGENAVK